MMMMMMMIVVIIIIIIHGRPDTYRIGKWAYFAQIFYLTSITLAPYGT